MKKILVLVTVILMLSSVSFGEELTQEKYDALEMELLTLKTEHVAVNVENYQLGQVPEFYGERYSIEKLYMAVAYFSGEIKNELPNGYGSLRIFDYADNGDLIRTFRLRGTFVNGVLVGDGTVTIAYEEDPQIGSLRDENGNFYYGLLNGQGNQVFSGIDKEKSIKETNLIDGTFIYGVRNGLFEVKNLIKDTTTETDGMTVIEKGNYSNGNRLGEWTTVKDSNIESIVNYEPVIQ